MLQIGQPGDVDQSLLKKIVDQTDNTTPMLSSLIRSVRPKSRLAITSQLVSMKLVAILIILCKSVHRNNSDYIYLFITFYLYLTGTRINAITFLNYLSLFVLHNMLLRKLREISRSSAIYIKAKASNCRLAGLWDNFEYLENIQKKRVGNTIKFRSVTMALQIKNGQKILSINLKQWISNLKQKMLDQENVASRPLNEKSIHIQFQCTCVY